jgi:putative endonuclease
MLDGDCLAIIEVRYRRSTTFTHAALSVDSRKQRKIIRTAALFSARHRAFSARVMRFDVVAVEGTGTPAITWIKDAFRPNDAAF